jgi:hypothetical protein
MAITYRREMTLVYQLTERMTDDQKWGLFQSNLHDNGVSLMDSIYNDKPSSNLGLQDLVSKTETLTITDEDSGAVIECPESMYHDEGKQLTKLFNDAMGMSLSCDLVHTEVTVEGYGVAESSRVFIEKGLTYDVTNDSTGRTDKVTMTVDICQPDWGNRTVSLKFCIDWEAKAVKKASVIEAMLVDLPLEDMGMVQRIVEEHIGLLAWDMEEPVIDCHFSHQTFSKSECAPDIMKKVRDARKAQEGTEEQ